MSSLKQSTESAPSFDSTPRAKWLQISLRRISFSSALRLYNYPFGIQPTATLLGEIRFEEREFGDGILSLPENGMWVISTLSIAEKP